MLVIHFSLASFRVLCFISDTFTAYFLIAFLILGIHSSKAIFAPFKASTICFLLMWLTFFYALSWLTCVSFESFLAFFVALVANDLFVRFATAASYGCIVPLICMFATCYQVTT